MIYASLGDLTKAKADLELSKKLEHFELTNAEFQLGQMNFMNLKINEAILAFNNVIALQSENPIYYLWRSRAFQMAGNLLRADADFKLYQEKVLLLPLQ